MGGSGRCNGVVSRGGEKYLCITICRFWFTGRNSIKKQKIHGDGNIHQMTIIPWKQRIRALLLSPYKMPTSSIVKPRCSRCFGRVMLWEEYKRLCGKLCNKDYQLKSASKWRTLFRPMVIPNVFSIVLGSKTKTHFTSFLRYVNFALAFGRNFIDGSMFRSPISPLSTHFIRHLSLIGPGKRKGWLIWKYKTLFSTIWIRICISC